MHKIIAVGGTGQDVLQMYLLAYLAGAVETPFDALVIDADRLHPGIAKLQAFLDDVVTDQARRGTVGVALPKIDYRQARPEGNSVAEVLLGRRPENGERTAAHAFFDTANLIQTVDRGLFARPALSSILGPEVLDAEELLPDEEGRVFIVGSVLGGTGGGLLARIVDATHDISRRQGRDAKIRAVIFGEYFEPSSDLIDRTRMRSNQYMVLRSLAEGARHVHSFAIIDAADGRRVERDSAVRTRIQIPDAEDHPLWRGVNALHWFRGDEVKDVQQEFTRREREVTPVLRLDDVRNRLARVAASCDTLVRKNIPELVAGEPWAESVWGRELTAFTRHALRVARSSGARDGSVAGARQITARVKDLWLGKPGTEGVMALLPARHHSVSPAYFRSVRWPNADAISGTLDDGVLRVAANYLFHCMRGTIV